MIPEALFLIVAVFASTSAKVTPVFIPGDYSGKEKKQDSSSCEAADDIGIIILFRFYIFVRKKIEIKRRFLHKRDGE